MNRINKCFQDLKEQNKKALITFITAGYPDSDSTERLVLELFDNGADIVEIGVPFSDPTAEGPVIQEASLRSLNNGTNLDGIFGVVKSLRKKTDKPIALMMYVNTIFKFGTEKFFEICKDTGIDGVIVPDLPFEERDEIKDAADKNGVININLIAPTSSKERIAAIAKESDGFIYCVSSTGVTGTRTDFHTDFNSFIGAVRDSSPVPACIGFGISDAAQAKKMSGYSDGVIVGSAIIKLIARSEPIGPFVKGLKAAV